MQLLLRNRSRLARNDRFFTITGKNPAVRLRQGSCPSVQHLESRTLLSAYTMHTLTTFNSFNGAAPFAGVVADSAGDLYGTTSNGPGTVYEFAHGATAVTTIATVGNYPQAGVAMDSVGNLYGTTTVGGTSNDGTVFEIVHGTTTPITLASFDGANGSSPESTLLLDPSGHLIGTTELGGSANDGTVFEINPANPVIQTLATFNGANGRFPYAGLVEDSQGNLFGATALGVPNLVGNQNGSIFEIPKTTGLLTTLTAFNTGAEPVGDLLLDSQGDIFATTAFGGVNGNHGTLVELPVGSNSLTTLFSFNGLNGNDSSGGLAMDSNGNLYGAAGGGAHGDGTLYQFNLASNKLTTLFSFNKTNGDDPTGDLYRDSAGNLYGTTRTGGSANEGVLFELSPPPAITGFTLINADTGKTIQTLQNGATINLAALPADLSIVANISGGIINSVLFSLDKNTRYRLDNNVPYAIFGYSNAHYGAGTFTLGTHTLTAEAWAQLNAKTLVARASTISFNVIDTPLKSVV